MASQQFPRSLVAPLVSILLHESEPPENLTWSCMATLSELGKKKMFESDVHACVSVCVCILCTFCVLLRVRVCVCVCVSVCIPF